MDNPNPFKRDHTINLQRVAHAMIILTVLFYMLVKASSIFIPFAFAILLAFMMKPICAFLEKYIPWRVLAIILTFIVAAIPIIVIALTFSWEFMDVYEDLPSIEGKLKDGFNKVFGWINRNLYLTNTSGEEWIKKNSDMMLEAPMRFIGSSISSSTAFLVSFGLTFIYTFLLLLYRSAFRKFFLMQFGEGPGNKAGALLTEVQQVTQGYLYGLLLVIFIIGMLNSLGLWILGVNYPMFWGFLAAMLAVIPYIGTFLGGLLTVVYSFATSDTLLQPVAVIGLFTVIQFSEGNFITPKVVGKSVKINPLAAIFSLVIGGAVWGIAGLILALPFIAIIKSIMQRIDILKPFSLLLSSELYNKEELFEEKFNKERYRLWKFFRKTKR